MNKPFILNINNIRVAVQIGEIQDDGQIEVTFTTIDKDINQYTKEQRQSIEDGVRECMQELTTRLHEKVNNAKNDTNRRLNN